MALKRVLFALHSIAAARVRLHYDRDSADILSFKARELAYAMCAPANHNAPLLTVCQYADEKWFGMHSLRSTLHSVLDHATVPEMKRFIKLMEEEMRFKAKMRGWRRRLRAQSGSGAPARCRRILRRGVGTASGMWRHHLPKHTTGISSCVTSGSGVLTPSLPSAPPSSHI